jgi:hypothetical protein
MHHPQLLVCEWDGRLANLLRPLAEENRWLLREPRQLSAFLRLLSRGGPGVLVLRAGRKAEDETSTLRNLEREFAMLEEVSWLYPDSAAVVVLDGEQPWLAGLAWDLGADYVLSPSQVRDRLQEIVTTLMAAVRPDVHGPETKPT